MKPILLRVALCTLVAVSLMGGGTAWLLSDDEPVLFQSEESSTEEYGPIYNRVSWQSTESEDIWMMQQSQGVFDTNFKNWERLIITVDKTTTPKTAKFVQTMPGDFDFSNHPKSIEFRVPCGVCHTNGPRAIRPVTDRSSFTPISWKDRVKIAVWNLRIKMYGRVVSSARTHLNEFPRKMPFEFDDSFAKRRLAVQTCNHCHNDSKWGRGPLTRQNHASILFMVEKGYMPPLGFGMSLSEESELMRFVKSKR